MSIKDIAGTIIAVVTVLGLGYAVALRGGYLVDEAGAGQLFEQKIAPESLERLEFMLEYKRRQLRELNRIDEPTPDDIEEKNDLRDDIKDLKTRIAKLKGVEVEDE